LEVRPWEGRSTGSGSACSAAFAAALKGTSDVLSEGYGVSAGRW